MHALCTALFLTLLSLQCHLALAQAPTSTSAPIGRPSPFQNTPGLHVAMPLNGMTVSQNQGVPFNVMLASGRAIGSISASIAPVDGSANTTILDLKQITLYRVLQLRNTSLSTLPLGDYYVQMIVTPNLSAPPANTGVPTAPAAAVPTSQIPPPNAPAVYYWRGLIHLAASEDSSTLNSAASTLGQGTAFVGIRLIWINMSIALGVLFVIFAFTL
ncbi:hypothetical protein EC968_009522 [Mortierella alpina]|nr:hypothetical protein EC968_009522 [Mortierella alpina]